MQEECEENEKEPFIGNREENKRWREGEEKGDKSGYDGFVRNEGKDKGGHYDERRVSIHIDCGTGLMLSEVR